MGGPIESFRSAVCRTAGFRRGAGLETCPSVGEVARSGDLATTWSVIAKTPGNCSWPVPYRAAHSGLLSVGMTKSDEKTKVVVPPFAGFTVPESKRIASGSPWRLVRV